MKARTHYQKGLNHIEICFGYEDNDGDRYGHYADMVSANNGQKDGYISCFLYSHYWRGCWERLNEMKINECPAVDDIKAFIENCKRYVSNIDTNK